MVKWKGYIFLCLSQQPLPDKQTGHVLELSLCTASERESIVIQESVFLWKSTFRFFSYVWNQIHGLIHVIKNILQSLDLVTMIM